MRWVLIIFVCPFSLFFCLFGACNGALAQSIHGKVVDRNGDALVGVDVLITNYQGKLYNWAVSDKKGFFKFDGIAAGPYNILVTNKGNVKSDKIYAYLDTPIRTEMQIDNQFSTGDWTRQIGMAVFTAILAAFLSFMVWKFQLGRHRKKAFSLIRNHFKPKLAESWRDLVESLAMVDNRKNYYHRVHAAYNQKSKVMIGSLDQITHRLETWLKQYEGILAEADPKLIDILIDCRSLVKEQRIRDTLVEAFWLHDPSERQKIMKWRDDVDSVLSKLNY